MTRLISSTLVIAMLAVGASAGISADSKSKSETKKSTKKSTSRKSTSKTKSSKAKKSSDVKHRLPFYYGKLELTDEQRAEIYAIQDKHDPKIEELKAQLAKLRETREKEFSTVLTTSQRKTLAGLRKKSSSRSTAGKSTRSTKSKTSSKSKKPSTSKKKSSEES